MYSNIPGVQILISLMKKHNIRHLVISPGTRNTALVHSVECDDFFKCYSVVDERSAGFFALGLSETLDVPVCVTCTAATATCNYMPAIKEAFERNIQLVALTADQGTYSKFHMGDQNINQTNMYDGYVKYAVDVPKIMNSNDYWYFNRCINEAFLELDHNEKGPIQINYRMDYSLEELSYFPEKEIKETRAVKRFDDMHNIDWNSLANELKNKRILVFCGSDYEKDNKLKTNILEFKKKTNSVILADYYSNIIDEEVINPSILGDVYGGKYIEELKPDIIILTGSNLYSPIKWYNSIFSSKSKTWQIAEDGVLNDGFRNVEKIFECESEDFFENINQSITVDDSKTLEASWKKVMDSIKFENLDFTHLYAIREFLKKIPDNSLIHMSVLDAIRISNYFKMPSNVKCFANIGADGIDGALSTFLGQASQTDKLAFLLIGDLSFMYDMNGLLQNIPQNVRIMVINNFAGSEFHKNFGLKRIPTLNKHIAAGHTSIMENVSSVNDFKYLKATNEDELKENIDKFLLKSNKPVILEVLTNADKDANKLKEIWRTNREQLMSSKQKIKKNISRIISPKTKKMIKKLIRR